MVEYAPGMRAEIRNEEWMIKKVEINSMGNRALHCVGISTLVKDREAVFLSDLEKIEIIDPASTRLVPDVSAHYHRTQLYLESQWRQKIPTDSRLHIGHKAAMDLMQFQLDPAEIALKRPRQRILIADAVGLGKTLEAGILMAELITRGKGKRILVVTAKSMMTQFQKEMWNRFTIPLTRLDSHAIQRIRAELPSNYNPFFYYDKTIISVDTLKRDVEYRTHLENAYWDIIVIDEAQNVADRGDHTAQRARLAKLLAGRSDTMIMLSATPHDGRAKSFASLMNMLDPTAIANPEEYTPEDIKGLCVRRFKKDIRDQVSGTFYERDIAVLKCKASKKEEAAYHYFTEMSLLMDKDKEKGKGQLFKTTLEKSLFSSPAACIKSIDIRIGRLKSKYPDGKFEDIYSLQGLKEALLKIEPADFSRYQELLRLLKDKTYNWQAGATDDRLVIFTERIETMKYLAENLKKDLGLKADAIQEISGAMTDMEQQKIVEDFGRSESQLRVLVASDVASEGLNLHYLSHRLIHFDIPWSLMVFQQRNGRIDRYGQKEQPIIRYMRIESDEPKIKGDARILDILVEKEQQAQKNIGDPAMLMGQYDQQAEEDMVGGAMENNISADDFSKSLDVEEEEFDPFELLMQEAEAQALPEREAPVDDETLFSDVDYLQSAVEYINRDVAGAVSPLTTVSGLDISLTDNMKKRLKALIPAEVMPEGNTLRLSDNKEFCMDEMKKSMARSMDSTAWPTVQYLWKLHPIMNWANDKCSLLTKRGEAPMIQLQGLKANQTLYIVCGTYQNRKATPVVDEWFGLLYTNNSFDRFLTMPEVLKLTKLNNENLPNPGTLTEADAATAQNLLPDVVGYARMQMETYFKAYKDRIDPLLDEEITKLGELEEKHRSYQMSLFESDRKRDEANRRVDQLFNDFTDWVKDTLELTETEKKNPYIRVITVVKGA